MKKNNTIVKDELTNKEETKMTMEDIKKDVDAQFMGSMVNNEMESNEDVEINSNEDVENVDNNNVENSEEDNNVDNNNDDNSDDNNEDEENDVEDVHIERTTAIEKVHIPKTIKALVKGKDKLRFDLCIQRNNVWSLEQKSLFIHSLMYGFPFPPAYAQDLGDDQNKGELWLLDGKQRLTTVIDFLEDKFKMHKNTPKVFGYEVAGKKFSELPEQFQDEIKDTNFTIYQMRGMTDEERDEMFVRLNKGTPLSRIESIRAMYSQLIPQLDSIANLEFFKMDVGLTKSAKNRFTDQELILQTAILLDEEHSFKGLGSPQIEAYVLNLKEKGVLLSDDVYNRFVEVCEYLSYAVGGFNDGELKNVLKKTNVPIIMATSLKAIRDEVSENVFGEFLADFFIRNYSKESEYGVANQSGSAKKENVVVRLHELEKAYDKFVNDRVKKDDIESNINNDMSNAV